MNKINKLNRIGKYLKCSVVGGEHYKAYIPPKLPPEPQLELEALYPLLDKANLALGKLEGMSSLLPNPSLFLYMYVRKEAVLSSQIEGTQSSLSDLLMYENKEVPGVPIDDVTEVSCYVSAMNYGLERLKTFPLSLRLLREIHEKLMKNARGGNKSPGEFRTSQNWIGGSRPGNASFVPVPPEKLMETLGDLETFFHDENVRLPKLIKAALAHVQFETIHPFLDGNGRLGRLLITFLLCVDDVLKSPLLYLSLYFKTHRNEYYNHLQSVRETGDWEAWIEFFLQGVIETASQATQAAHDIVTLFKEDLLKLDDHGKATTGLVKIHNYFQKNPISNTKNITEACDISLPAALRNLVILEELGVIREVTGKERNKVFVYDSYLKILSKGTEPLKS
jgi:Fic family protein